MVNTVYALWNVHVRMTNLRSAVDKMEHKVRYYILVQCLCWIHVPHVCLPQLTDLKCKSEKYKFLLKMNFPTIVRVSYQEPRTIARPSEISYNLTSMYREGHS
jgi:hypothetical protein